MAVSASHMSLGDPRPSRRERVLDVLRTIVINVLFAALVVVVGYSLIVTYQLKQYETWQKKVEVDTARTQLAQDVEINDDLKRQIRFLRTEDGVEKVARERLGLVRPNESTYVVVNGPAAQARPKARPSPSVEPEAPPAEAITVQAWRLVQDVWNGGE